ncbi:50S ribosomal protein L25 [Flaviaesturariibacter amylovorans]|uniref:Large ribosomal subunit protein bL25 n=1 Tax=Flaviaesturariibacter amylovorans TaxID=1084520 RepID=A0ABP8G8X0_9BACT
MKAITIEGQLRTAFGKSATRQLRSQELVPGVIYGGAKEINFTTSARALRPIVYTPSFQLVDVTIDGKTTRCILKDLQFDKISDELIHVDLLELVEDKKVVATIPIKFTGTALGVRAGGRLETKMKALKVKTLPKYLKEQIEVPVDALEIGANLRVQDIVTENYEVLNSPRIPIVSIVTTRALRQEEAAAAKAAPAKGKK